MGGKQSEGLALAEAPNDPLIAAESTDFMRSQAAALAAGEGDLLLPFDRTVHLTRGTLGGASDPHLLVHTGALLFAVPGRCQTVAAGTEIASRVCICGRSPNALYA